MLCVMRLFKRNEDVSVGGMTGYLVPLKNLKMMAEKIERLLDNESLRRRVGVCAAEMVVDNYTWDVVSRGLLCVVYKIILSYAT